MTVCGWVGILLYVAAQTLQVQQKNHDGENVAGQQRVVGSYAYALYTDLVNSGQEEKVRMPLLIWKTASSPEGRSWGYGQSHEHRTQTAWRSSKRPRHGQRQPGEATQTDKEEAATKDTGRRPRKGTTDLSL
jgi:hypothetical protein